MRIGHYSPWLISPGGIQSYLRQVVRGQRERGHEVILFNRPSLVPSEAASAFGAEIIPTRDDTDLLRHARTRGLDALHTHTAVEVPPAPNDLPALVRTMHGHEAYCPSGTRYLARPTGRPCPRGCHVLGCTWGHFVNRCGSIRPNKFVEDFRRVRRERRGAQRFFTIAISRFVKEQMVRAGYKASAIRVIYNPAPDLPLTAEDGGGLGDQDGPPRFLFLGRIVPGKGLDWLIRAATQVHVDVDFEIIGDGPGKPPLLELSRQLGVGERFSWLGWLESEREIFARLAAARAIIFPSLWHEPAGLVTLEAAAAARAVIASRVGGIPEYAEKLDHALLVAPNDTKALAAAITRLADDADLAAQLGRAGWQRLVAGEFSLNKHLDQLEEVYARAGK
jgi:glycosyltransferase involved in cell wall biosynthesis